MATDRERLRSQFGSFRVVFTKRRGDAAALAGDAARKGAKFIIACGGDGNYQKLQTVFYRPEKTSSSGSYQAALAVISEERLNSSQSRAAARVLSTGRTVKIDVGRVSFIDNNGNEAMRYFLGVASCGMSTKVIERVKSEKVSFASSLLQTAMRTTPIRLAVQLTILMNDISLS